MVFVAGPRCARIFASLWLAAADDTTQEALHAQHAKLLEQEGLIHLIGALSEEKVDLLKEASDSFTSRLDVRGRAYVEKLKQKKGKASTWKPRDSNSLFCFDDVVQRDPGKVEVALPGLMDPNHPLGFVARGLGARGSDRLPWAHVVEQALGEDAELFSTTLILSMAQSFFGEEATDQGWHSDGSFLPGNSTCRNCVEGVGAYGLVVYCPLVDVEDDGGSVEYLLSSHDDLGKWIDEPYDPEAVDEIHRKGLESRKPKLGKGDVIAYDYRLMHRGLARRVPEGNRPVLKIDYFKKGVGDRDNLWCSDRGKLVKLPKAASKEKLEEL